MCKVSTIEGCLTAWLNSSSSGERAAIWEGLKQITHVELCILLFLSFSTLSGSKSCSLAPLQQHSLLLPPGSVWPWQQAQKGGSVSLAEDEGGWLVYLFWGGCWCWGWGSAEWWCREAIRTWLKKCAYPKQSLVALWQLPLDEGWWPFGNARLLVVEENLSLGSTVTESHIWIGCSSASCNEASKMFQWSF